MPLTLTEQPLIIGCSAAFRAGSCIASESWGRRSRALEVCSGSRARTAGGPGPGARASRSLFCGGSAMPLTAPWHVIPSLAPTKLIVGELLCSFPLSPCEAPHSRVNPDRVSLRFSCRPSRENTSSRDNSCLGGLFLDHPPSVPFPELPLGGRGQDDCG